MAVSVSSIVGFSSTSKYGEVTRTQVGASLFKAGHFASHSKIIRFRRCIKGKTWGLQLLVANGDHVDTHAPDKGSKDAEESIADDGPTRLNLLTDSLHWDSQAENSTEANLRQSPDIYNGSTVPSDLKENLSSANVKSTLKRTPLTAREKLRAAKVLSRYIESKKSKPELGSKVLEALKESDRGKKRSGLPEAPTNLFDDSKRGLPKQGWTFEFPGGVDVFVVVFSFVFISTVMFATTYIVWKSGAIHFNEY